MLGSACMRAFGSEGGAQGSHVIGRDLDDFDLADRAATLAAIAELAPRLIVNCAAATDVDRCETDRDYADRGNLLAPKHAAEAAAALGARLVHISTDFVFKGDKPEAYTESDVPEPVSYYGASKLAGEEAVLTALPDALIVRASWLYGHGGDHFPGKVLRWAAGGRPLRVVDDQTGSPTYAEDLAAALRTLADREATGLYHLGGAGCATRLEWARKTLFLASVDIEVLPASTADFPMPAARPANSCLDCSKAARLGIELPPWQDGLSRYIRSATASSPNRRLKKTKEQTPHTDVLILGAKGMLGSACMRVFGGEGGAQDSHVVGRDLDDFDLADRAATMAAITDLAPRLIVNCAAAAEVDRCETDRDYAERGNILVPTHLAEAASEVSAKVVHLSTVFVFDGEKEEPYVETDLPRPINYYGITKLAGEGVIFATAPGALVVRTSWMYGLSGLHFPGKLREWVASGGPLRIVDDQIGSPTYAEDLAVGLKALVEKDASGLYHLGGAGCTSRIEYTQEILDVMGLGAAITPAATKDFPLPAARPANSCLDCGKAAVLGVELPPWRESLARYIRAYQEGGASRSGQSS